MKLRLFKRITALLAAALFLLCAMGFTMGTPEQSVRNLYTAVKTVNIRSGPGTGYSVVGTLRAGSFATKVGQSGGWARIVVLGNDAAFVPMTALTYTGEGTSIYCIEEAISYATSQILYAAARLNIRSGPGMGYDIVETRNEGEAVTVMGVNGAWSLVKMEGNVVGYAYSASLTEEQPQASSYYTVQTLTTTSNFNAYESEYFMCYLVSSRYIIPIRTAENGDSAIVGYMKDDPSDYIEVLNLTTDWVRINYHGVIGYVPFDLVTVYRIYRQIY